MYISPPPLFAVHFKFNLFSISQIIRISFLSRKCLSGTKGVYESFYKSGEIWAKKKKKENGKITVIISICFILTSSLNI